MKKLFVLLMSAGLVFGCSEDTSIEVDNEEKGLDEVQNKESYIPYAHGRSTICGGHVEYGTTTFRFNPTTMAWEGSCEDSSYVCWLNSWFICHPVSACELGFCEFPGIFDPLELVEIIDPLEIPSIQDYVKDDIRQQYIFIPVNERLLILQTYQPLNIFFEEGVSRHATSIKLEGEIAEYEMDGNVIAAGIYPMLYNNENDTYNTIVSVTQFPIKTEKPVMGLPIDGFSGSLNELFQSNEPEHLQDAELIETDIELFDLAPYLQEKVEGAYIFSNGLFDLDMIFYGDPSPQPSKVDPTTTPIKEEPTPEPMKIWLNKEMWLPQSISEILGIEPFILKNENIIQSYDEKAGVLRVKILNR
ncbi:hypothetical protein E1176_16510 [Fulvivirga sp. RKSG066]|uniref:hypothetical protein n=1 Tax=Fulvivirga aurantia TaxID=2529383 RepID=UPI0012BCB731|nr:hypothetical protein [Fulvivirga aurantia]MTI22636.1 hypothetical protein [Fulvivirga aurantia]